jgi:hypothetical protein
MAATPLSEKPSKLIAAKRKKFPNGLKRGQNFR